MVILNFVCAALSYIDHCHCRQDQGCHRSSDCRERETAISMVQRTVICPSILCVPYALPSHHIDNHLDTATRSARVSSCRSKRRGSSGPAYPNNACSISRVSPVDDHVCHRHFRRNGGDQRGDVRTGQDPRLRRAVVDRRVGSRGHVNADRATPFRRSTPIGVATAEMPHLPILGVTGDSVTADIGALAAELKDLEREEDLVPAYVRRQRPSERLPRGGRSPARDRRPLSVP